VPRARCDRAGERIAARVAGVGVGAAGVGVGEVASVGVGTAGVRVGELAGVDLGEAARASRVRWQNPAISRWPTGSRLCGGSVEHAIQS
jgi:hypothetical protein